MLDENSQIPYTNGWPGKCHLCKELREIKFCPLCDHWFCADCRKNWFKRAQEAGKELVMGKQPGCCGPVEELKDGLR